MSEREDVDVDDVDEALYDATCDGDGRPRRDALLHHLAKRGLRIVKIEPAPVPAGAVGELRAALEPVVNSLKAKSTWTENTDLLGRESGLTWRDLELLVDAAEALAAAAPKPQAPPITDEMVEAGCREFVRRFYERAPRGAALPSLESYADDARALLRGDILGVLTAALAADKVGG